MIALLEEFVGMQDLMEESGACRFFADGIRVPEVRRWSESEALRPGREGPRGAG